jgi:hypothetical protein
MEIIQDSKQLASNCKLVQKIVEMTEKQTLVEAQEQRVEKPSNLKVCLF